MNILFWGMLIHSTFCRYNVENLYETKNGLSAFLILEKGSYSRSFPDPIKNLTLRVFFETSDRVRVKITDSESERWEVPHVVVSKTPEQKPPVMNYRVDVEKTPFSLKIVRPSDESLLLDTSVGEFFYCDQFIEFSTDIGEEPNIYGLAEHLESFRLPTNKTYVLWNEDNAGVPHDKNLYGSHPMYMQVKKGGISHGVFLVNSNAQDINIGEEVLRWRTIGGIIDLFVFAGASPKNVSRQYQEVVGKPAMPAYWTLGNHQCRWGYLSVNISRNVFHKFEEYQIPLDTMWNDLDYMDGARDFTNNPHTFPYEQLMDYINELHEKNRKYVQIIDPGIKNETGYYPFDEGVKRDVFIKTPDGEVINDLLWPGFCVWPDYFNPDAAEYWKELTQKHVEKYKIDGVWIDMNEIATLVHTPHTKPTTSTSNTRRNYSKNFDPRHPPYVPPGLDMEMGTLRVDGVTGTSMLYNTHNLYAFEEAKINYDILSTFSLKKKRPFILTRATFSGSHRYAAHWTGDVASSFDQLEYSIKQLLTFGILGYQSVGADICGFMKQTTEELCTRWYQIGSFYGFMRNHNDLLGIPQEPWAFGKTLLEGSKKVILMRYSLLPYLYTQHFFSFRDGSTYFTPLLLEFPDDARTYDNDAQFIIGDTLLVSPVFRQGETSVVAYFPDAVWYDFFTGEKMDEDVYRKAYAKLDAPIDVINVHVRGGKVIPMKAPEMTTFDTRHNPFHLIVALDTDEKSSKEEGNNGQKQAEGFIYIDDGESIDAFESGQYSLAKISAVEENEEEDNMEIKKLKISCAVEADGFQGTNVMVDEVDVWGVEFSPTSITVDGKEHSQFQYDKKLKTLKIYSLYVTVLDEWVVEVVMSS